MKEIVSTVTSRGQVAIPVEVRRHLGLRQGDKVSFVIEEDGMVVLKATTDPTITSPAGEAGKLGQPMSWDQVREIAREDRFDAKHKDV